MAKKASTHVSRPVAPTPAEIAERAHEIYMARGGNDGKDLDDWIEAESELLNEQSMRRRPQG